VIKLAIGRPERKRPRRKEVQIGLVLRMLEYVATFMEENGAQDCKAYVSFGNGAVGLYLVATSKVYDFELGDKLAEFAAPYIERGLLGFVRLLPASTAEELTAYFDPRRALRIELEQVEHA
jgi:hypothetical protein